MNFIEFNCPDILKDAVNKIANRKSVLEIQWKRNQVKIVGTFNADKMQKFIEKTYQSIYDSEMRRQNAMYKEINKSIKSIKDNYLQSKQYK